MSRTALAALLLTTVLTGRPALAQTPPPGTAGSSIPDDARNATATATAAPGPATAVDAVVVTARRQTEKAQDVPISLSVLSGAALDRTGAYTLQDIQHQVPSLVSYSANPRNSSIGIRGLGVTSAQDGADTSVGVYVDDVYLGRPGMALDDLIDIGRVEVLRGPQGTLFGRNSSAGLLNITTNKPSFTPSTTAEVSVGDYSYNQERLSTTGPLVADKLAYRLTLYNTGRDGVLHNRLTGGDDNSVARSGARLQLLATPGPRLSLRLIGEYSTETDSCCVSVLKTVLPASITAATRRTLSTLNTLGYTPVADVNSTSINAAQSNRVEQGATSMEANLDLGWADATSITAWRYWHFHPLQDSDGTPLDVIQVNVAKTRDEQVTQEFRLASKPGRFNWQSGLYYFHQRLSDHYILNQFGADASSFYTAYARTLKPTAAAVSVAPGSQYLDTVLSHTDSLAGFGQANFDVTDRLTLTTGLRYTYDWRDGTAQTSTVGTPPASIAIPFNYDLEVNRGNLSGLASAAYHITRNQLAYFTYSTGYKAAGLNLDSSTAAGSTLVLKPEKTRNWELGLKQSLFRNRVTLNVDGYWTVLTGLQANIYPVNGAKSYLTNVGNIRARGVEAEAVWQVLTGLSLAANGAYNDARYTSYANAPCPVGGPASCNLTGRPVYESPRWVGNLTGQYQFDYDDRTRPYVLVQYSYRAGVFGTVDDGPYTRVPSYSLVNARIGSSLSAGRYDLAFWVNNLTDKRYFETLGTASIPGASAFGVSGLLGPRRTYGATLRASF